MILKFIKNLFFPPFEELNVFGRTDTGRVRAHNEDSFCILPEQSMMIVADGMGGHNAGEVASRVAIESMVNHLEKNALRKATGNHEEIRHLMIQGLRKTNQTVINMAKKNEQYSGMGCTFIIGYVNKGFLYLCHVGDVRCYIYRNHALKQITTDHTYAAEVTKKLEKDPNFDQTTSIPARNIVSRAVGFPFHEDPETHITPIQTDDRILLCSDGLWSMIEDDKLSELIRQSQNPEDACDTFVEQANQAGGKDNITAAIAFI